MKLKLLAVVALLVVGGAAIVFTVGGLPGAAAASTTYLTATAAVGDVSDDVAATGTVASSTTWSLAFGSTPSTADAAADSNATGDSTGTWIVKTITAKVGDGVKKDQVLGTATNPTLAASIVAAKNDRTAAKLQLAEAQDAYDDATTTSALRQTRSQLLNATNAVATAEQNVKDLQAVAARTRLVAPAAGIVTAVSASAGADAPSGAAITIESTDYQVTAEVVESDIAAMRLQQPASVSVPAVGADLAGTVTTIAPTASSSSSGDVVSYAVTVALANPPATLRAGMTADVTITTASATGVLAVPAAAVRGIAGSYSVLVLSAAGQPEARPVTVGLMTSSLVEIQSGLNAGDVVVTGTASQQRATTVTDGGAGFAVPGGGGGRVFRTGPGN